MEYKVGDKVWHTSKEKWAIVTAVNVGLGYYISHSGFVWSVPHKAILPSRN